MSTPGSTVTITPLVPGALATSAAVNLTLSSWNSATAAGQIGASNVRLEGIDRRTLSGPGHVVFTEETGTNTPVIVGATLATNSVAYALVPGATCPAAGDLSMSTHTRVLLHAALDISSPALAPAPLPMITVILQQSTDGGGTWTDLIGTRQRFSVRLIGVLCATATSIPGVVATPGWCVTVAPLATVRYRIAYKTVNGNFNLNSGTIFVETFGR